MVACREGRSPPSLEFKICSMLSAQAFGVGMAGSQLTPATLALLSTSSLPQSSSLYMDSPSVESFPPLLRDDHLQSPAPDASFLRCLKTMEKGLGFMRQQNESPSSSSVDPVDKHGSPSSKDTFPGFCSPPGPLEEPSASPRTPPAGSDGKCCCSLCSVSLDVLDPEPSSVAMPSAPIVGSALSDAIPGVV